MILRKKVCEMEKSFVISGKDATEISKIVKEISEEVSFNALGYVISYFEKKEKEKEEEKKHTYDKVLHNTELRMNNYRNFKEHITGVEDLENEIMENWIIEWDDDSKVIDQILKTRARTETVLKHIDNCLEYYKLKCEASDKDEIQKRYKIIKMLYLEERKMSHFDIMQELRREK